MSLHSAIMKIFGKEEEEKPEWIFEPKQDAFILWEKHSWRYQTDEEIAEEIAREKEIRKRELVSELIRNNCDSGIEPRRKE